MLSANFKLKRTAVALCGFLATARFSCCHSNNIYWRTNNKNAHTILTAITTANHNSGTEANSWQQN